MPADSGGDFAVATVGNGTAALATGAAGIADVDFEIAVSCAVTLAGAVATLGGIATVAVGALPVGGMGCFMLALLVATTDLG